MKNISHLILLFAFLLLNSSCKQNLSSVIAEGNSADGQVKDLTDLISSGGPVQLKTLRVDGGPTRNRLLMQFQADILQTKVERAGIEEISALGSALMAGLATGFWKDLNEIISLRSVDTIFEPEKSRSEVDKLFTGWKNAVKKSRL